ncbi:uncharacterized protein LOC116207712 [Punica granatum]|uniref:Uncharacterized protein n=2 Tax=Punica granatum TaxID=22663 RepID=A0A218XDD3_PUNGR|nr:uncharacterized protein LOC116207712 [Punica granatum]OWM82491.1 hypothetical protein CDL15_Pgr002066 [Punica granatum]PKI72534.1 hypothetical protein CRG98_007056 [Punica granatum]
MKPAVDEHVEKVVEKTHFKPRHPHTVKYIERKLEEKGLLRQERHPVDGLGGIRRPAPKSGHGGKYTWEGPEDVAESELAPTPPALDERDPNFVDEETEEKIVRGEDEEVEGYVVGEVEVPKAEEVGVARVDVDPHLKTN